MVNKCYLIGNIGSDPEVKNLESGSKVAKFSVATHETFKNKNGEKVTQTEWHNVVVWRSVADFVEKYAKKGALVSVIGKITTRSWDDKDGNKRYITEIVCNELKLLSKSENATAKAEALPTEEIGANEPADDLPF